MTSEVKAIRARLRRVAQGYPISVVYDYLPGGYLSSRRADMEAAHQKDRDAIVAIDLAEHPADEDEAITDDWLRRVGAQSDGHEPWIPVFFDTHGVWLIARHSGGVWHLYGARMKVQPKTRGQFRRLCAALGIPLTEQAKEPA